MNNKNNNLIWLDLKMTGLNPEQDVILEIAVVITDIRLNIIAESQSYAIWQPESILKTMDKWNTNCHTKSGLIQRVIESDFNLQKVENEIIQLIKHHTTKNQSPMCGNTIHQDRKFLSKYMPNLESWFHYRNIDVSTIKELAKRWHPDIYKGFKKHNKHQALEDIYESITELMYYKNIFFDVNL